MAWAVVGSGALTKKTMVTITQTKTYLKVCGKVSNHNDTYYPPRVDEAPQDASFQSDPEHYYFSCLSTEEAWNYLDSTARDVSKTIKVGVVN